MVARIEYRSILTALLLGLAAALFLALLPRMPEQMAMRAGALGPLVAEGETTQIRSFYGFHEVEIAGAMHFRWTDGLGNFVVRNGERLGAPLVLRMRLCGCRADAVGRLLVRVNGTALADVTSTASRPEWRRYALLVPAQATAYSPDLLIELVSDTIKNPQYGYPMGVALDSVELAPAAPQRAYGPLSALALGLAIGLIALAAGRTKNKEQRTKGQRTPSPLHPFTPSPLHPLIGVVVAAALGLTLVAAQGLLYRRQALPAEVLAGGLLLALGTALLARMPARTTAVIVLLLSALVVAPQVLGAWMLDDAYISFRYASNALAGYGFVFNPGERVEGYTNFLWTALFVPILGIGLDPALAAQGLLLLLALAIAGLTWFGARRLAGATAATCALALLITSAPFVLYAARGSGMETALFTLLALAATLVYLTDDRRPTTDNRRPEHTDPRPETREPGNVILSSCHLVILSPPHLLTPSSFLGLLLALAAMTRPEGVLIAGVCGLHLLATSWRAGLIAWRRLFGLTLGFLAIFGPYYLWRLGYYGYPLPNTFYAKVGGTAAQALRGLGYAAAFASSQAPLIAIALLGLLPIKNKHLYGEPSVAAPVETTDHRPQTTGQVVHRSSFVVHRSSFLWLLVGLYTFYIVVVGGDHFPLYRFFVPLLPPLALLAALALGRLGEALPRPAAAPATALLVAAAIGWQAPQLYQSRTLNASAGVWTENTVVEKNREIGLWLRANTAPDTLIATGIAGALPFYAERPVLDMLGLNDLHIAHLAVPTIGQGVAGSEKTDNDYILRRQPDYIPYSSVGALLEDPRFLELYDRGIVHGPEGRWVRLYKWHGRAPPPGWTAIDDQ